MKRFKQTLRNLLIIAISLFLFMQFNGLYFSPVKAMHASERDLHYGPSEIVHSFDYGDSRFFLTRYEDYISLKPIKRALGIFWRYGGGYGAENHKDRPLYCTYGSQDSSWWICGIRNDSDISRVEVVMQNSDGNKKTVSSNTFYEDLFYVIWEDVSEAELGYHVRPLHISAYNHAGDLVYESDF